jgi:hypothetical protein
VEGFVLILLMCGFATAFLNRYAPMRKVFDFKGVNESQATFFDAFDTNRPCPPPLFDPAF